MPQQQIPRADVEAAIAAVDEAVRRGYSFGLNSMSAFAEAGRILNIKTARVRHCISMGQQRYRIGMHIPAATRKATETQKLKIRRAQHEAPPPPGPKLPDMPDDDIPESEIIDIMCRRYTKRAEHKAAKKWFRIEMPSDEPFGIMWWGDPHLDNNGTNWPLLKAHAALAGEPGIYSVNIGDTLDNWPHGSRLMSLYAHSDTSAETARKLARWFLRGAGITWLVWLYGNHDLWGGHTQAEWMREVGGSSIAFEDWGAQFVLACPGGAEFKVWASHDFPGSSMWNTLHGAQKAAHMKEDANLYVCGHTHNWALHKEESGSRGFCYSLIRTRGYKFIDSHAEKLGHFPQQFGASILTVFDPATERHHNFEHPEDGVLFLRALRQQAAA